MDIWELLGIPPTTEIGTIKSAYARQAKLHHPEEHPEEFKALQNAYKMALRIAKSRKAEASAEKPEMKSEASAEKPEMKSEASVERPEMKSEASAERPEMKSEASAERPEMKSEASAERPEMKSEPASDMPDMKTESSGDVFRGEKRQEGFAGASEKRTEQSYDYSDIDPYGDRERFFRQFVLIGKSPYLRNNLDAWDEFLDEKEFIELFANADFRMKFVRTMCRQSGWRRKTISYFERYLNQFHTEQNQPADGKWETQLICFRMKKLPRLRLPAFCMDRFWGKEGIAFHKKLWSKLSSSLGRELNFDIKADVARYMKLYLFFGESNKATEDFINRLHRSWVRQQAALAWVVLTICLFVGLRQIYSAEQRKVEDSQLEYIRELYDLDSDTYSVEEQKKELREYHYDWKRAEEGLDDVLERYVDW